MEDITDKRKISVLRKVGVHTAFQSWTTDGPDITDLAEAAERISRQKSESEAQAADIQRKLDDRLKADRNQLDRWRKEEEGCSTGADGVDRDLEEELVDYMQEHPNKTRTSVARIFNLRPEEVGAVASRYNLLGAADPKAEERKKVLELAKVEGATVKSISAEVGVSTSFVYKVLRLVDGPVRSRREWRNQVRSQVAEKLRAGVPITAIIRDLKVSSCFVYGVKDTISGLKKEKKDA
jgi:hypothetical protein